jgi:hypothetical protein
MVPKAKMLTEVMSFVLKDVKKPVLKKVSRVSCKNGIEVGCSSPLKLAHLAEAAVQHEGVKQWNYDASLYLFYGLGSVVGVQRA